MPPQSGSLMHWWTPISGCNGGVGTDGSVGCGCMSNGTSTFKDNIQRGNRRRHLPEKPQNPSRKESVSGATGGRRIAASSRRTLQQNPVAGDADGVRAIGVRISNSESARSLRRKRRAGIRS